MSSTSVNLDLKQVEVVGGTVGVIPTPGQPLQVEVVSGPPSSSINNVLVFAQITSVASGTETTIASYTCPIGVTTSYLQAIEFSGINNGSYQVYKNGILIGTKYTTYGAPLNGDFNYRVSIQDAPGQPLLSGDVVRVTVIQQNTSAGTFNASIQVSEFT